MLARRASGVLIGGGVRCDDLRLGRARARERLPDLVFVSGAPFVGERELTSLAAERQRRRQPDAHRAAGDEYGLPAEIIHRRT